MSNAYPPGWIPAPDGWTWSGYSYDSRRGTVWYDRSNHHWIASVGDGEYSVVVEDPTEGFIWIVEGT